MTGRLRRNPLARLLGIRDETKRPDQARDDETGDQLARVTAAHDQAERRLRLVEARVAVAARRRR